MLGAVGKIWKLASCGFARVWLQGTDVDGFTDGIEEIGATTAAE